MLLDEVKRLCLSKDAIDEFALMLKDKFPSAAIND